MKLKDLLEAAFVKDPVYFEELVGEKNLKGVLQVLKRLG